MISECRETLNNKVKELGNKIKPGFFKYPGLSKKYHCKYGLGDLLTTDITFTKVGAVTGVALPFIAGYDCLNMGYKPTGAYNTCLNFILNSIGSVAINAAYLFIPSIIGGIIGGIGGALIDAELSKKYPSYYSRIKDSWLR